MELPYLTASAERVRAVMAALILEQGSAGITLRDVKLAPHQVSGVNRIDAAFREFGGALLCDTVGVGKTFVGAAVASRARAALLVAPATLKTMWREAAMRTGFALTFVSIESLSSRDPPTGDWEVIVVDEAHHFRNPATIRHRVLAQLARGRNILLMTGTPIHNSRRDLSSLASLFLGTRAERLSETELGRLVIRRDRDQARLSGRFPDTDPTVWLSVEDRPEIPGKLYSLPPPVPLRDEGEASDLVVRGLLKQWASSERALAAAIRRRLAKAAAMQSSLEHGRYPSKRDIRSWITSEDSVQLGFAELVSEEGDADCARLLDSVRAHCSGLHQLLNLVRGRSIQDAERISHLRAIFRNHRGRIVAFASYGATVRAYFDALRAEGGLAALTSSGGQVVGGRIGRREILEQFSPESFQHPVPRANAIRLLLTTDLLSEGVNLQDADVVVHLDLPWTDVRMEQRVGRLSRLGSRHRKVAVYAIRPPASAERLLENENLLQRKRAISVPTIPMRQEQIRQILGGWRLPYDLPALDETLIAAVESARGGFLALVRAAGRHRLICRDENGVTDQPARVTSCCEAATGAESPVDSERADDALQQISDWLRAESAVSALGLGTTGFLETRRRLINRVNAVASTASLERRSRLLPLIEAAREVAQGTHGSAVEQELSKLAAASDQPDGAAWLERVIGLREERDGVATSESAGNAVIAVLLLMNDGGDPVSGGPAWMCK